MIGGLQDWRIGIVGSIGRIEKEKETGEKVFGEFTDR